MVTVLLGHLPCAGGLQYCHARIERRWTLPEPVNDIIRNAHFTVTVTRRSGQRLPPDYLAAHADYSLGNFSTATAPGGAKFSRRATRSR